MIGAVEEKHIMYWAAHQGHWCGLSWVLGASRSNEGAWRRGWRGAGSSRQCRSPKCPQRQAREEAQRAGGSCSRSTLGPTMQGLTGWRPPVSICAHCPHSLRSVPARTINYEATLFTGHITEFVPRSTSVQEGLVIAPTPGLLLCMSGVRACQPTRLQR